MQDITIRRLDATHAEAVVSCFQRVYGGTYANDTFNEPTLLAEAMAAGRVRSVGALSGDTVLAHMAMNLAVRDAVYAELGNTVVDPDARGGGLAWQVGGELTQWCREIGHTGFLHYPTTDHHIMQAQSVKSGFEVGLMLGYVPAETDGQVADTRKRLRSAATIVFEPIDEPQQTLPAMLPSHYANLCRELAELCGIPRAWQPSRRPSFSETIAFLDQNPRRGLARLHVQQAGEHLPSVIDALTSTQQPCLQIDIALSEAGVDEAVEAARTESFVFCGWLPGYRRSDVLRLQRVREDVTDLNPNVVNPGGQRFRALIASALGGSVR